MFEYMNKIYKQIYKTTYGSVKINNVVFNPKIIEDELPELVLRDENLKHMFAELELSESKKINIYNRFIPKEKIRGSVKEYIDDSLKHNRTFYSFLAEGILGLVYRDLYSFDLAKGIIDMNETLTDSHNGVDACMYNIEKKCIVLGEAKFYQNLDSGVNAIVSDFMNKNIKNKIESLHIGTVNNELSRTIVIRNLQNGEYYNITVDEFLNQKIIFAGFVLHSEQNIKKYMNTDYYEKFSLSVEKLESNIKKSLCLDKIEGEYEIILVHLPINSKKELIMKMIEAATQKKLEIL